MITGGQAVQEGDLPRRIRIEHEARIKKRTRKPSVLLPASPFRDFGGVELFLGTFSANRQEILTQLQYLARRIKRIL